MKTIRFYHTPSGQSPIEDFLWEVRVTSGSDIFRFLGFFDGKDIIVLSHAFQKKTQKTPKQASKIAEERKRDYLRRKQK
ncbi:MAG: type II toxin-antitoxin system RelE/ParE family toxin [Desulfobacteraceae bacterium]|nr:type II toxin-antitoxin system RelE/ParE family toxin [Desulfobacteraceae bacterium]